MLSFVQWLKRQFFTRLQTAMLGFLLFLLFIVGILWYLDFISSPSFSGSDGSDLGLSSSCQMSKEQLAKIQFIGHRGSAGTFPENTIPSIREGLQATSFVEIDLQISKDKEIWLFHDKLLQDKTNGSGRVYERDGAYLSTLTIKESFMEKLHIKKNITGRKQIVYKLCTLEEALKIIKKTENYNVLLDISCTKSMDCSTLVQKTVDMLEREEINHSRVYFSSKQAFILKDLQRKISFTTHFALSIDLGWWYSSSHRLLSNHIAHYDAVSAYYGLVLLRPGIMRSILHSRRKERCENRDVFAWTVNDYELVRRLICLRISNIITDHPRRMRERFEMDH